MPLRHLLTGGIILLIQRTGSNFEADTFEILSTCPVNNDTIIIDKIRLHVQKGQNKDETNVRVFTEYLNRLGH